MQASDAKAAGQARGPRAADSPSPPADTEMFAVQQLTAMEQPSWNEGRLDDLNKRVYDGFKRMDDEFKAVRGEMKGGFAKVDDEFKAIRGKVKGMQRLMAQGAIAISGSMVLGFVTMATVMVVKL